MTVSIGEQYMHKAAHEHYEYSQQGKTETDEI